MMTIISYFLSHIETDSSAFSKTEYYEMKLLTGKDKTHCTFERLEDVEVRICPRQHQKAVWIF